MLTGTIVTMSGFVPIGFAASIGRRYTFSLFAVIAIALLVSWFVAVMFSPVIAVCLMKAPDKPPSGPGRAMHAFRRLLARAMRAAGSRSASRSSRSCCRSSACACRASSSRPPTGRSCS